MLSAKAIEGGVFNRPGEGGRSYWSRNNVYWHPIRNLVISTTCSYFECVQPIQPILSSVVYNFILSERAPGPRSIKLILFQIMIYLCI